MMDDRRRLPFAILLGFCVNLLMLAAGEIFLRFSKQDFPESAKNISVVQVVLGKSIQEKISSSQIIQDENICDEEEAIASIQNDEEIFSTQKQNDEDFDQLADRENVLTNSAASNFNENIFSQSANNFEASAENNFSSSSQNISEAEKNKLVEMIYALIEKEKEYPALARRRNIEGNVDVSISVSSDGKLEAEKISASSGTTILDQAAINLIKNIFPVDIVLQSKTELIITIHYSLRD
jgi:protein TonB